MQAPKRKEGTVARPNNTRFFKKFFNRKQRKTDLYSEREIGKNFHTTTGSIPMTWVVGASTLFGYGAIISDIQVSNESLGFKMDVLQKAYPLGKYIVAGFAGGVVPGLALLENLKNFLSSVDIAEGECWDPQWIADNWPYEARRVYQHLENNSPVPETHILMLGMKAAGTPEKRVMGGAIGHLTVFRSPDFLPESKTGGRKTVSIGCGANVGKYTSVLEALMRDDDGNYMKAELFNPGGYGRQIAETITWMTKKNPVFGISRYFQLFIVRMGEIKQWNPRGMPEIAQNLDELKNMLNGQMAVESLVAN